MHGRRAFFTCVEEKDRPGSIQIIRGDMRENFWDPSPLIGCSTTKIISWQLNTVQRITGWLFVRFFTRWPRPQEKDYGFASNSHQHRVLDAQDATGQPAKQNRKYCISHKARIRQKSSSKLICSGKNTNAILMHSNKRKQKKKPLQSIKRNKT